MRPRGKPSEDAARYSKFAGVTLAGIYVDQPEEIPEDFFAALLARLSQPDYPHQMLLTPDPPAEDHWLARAFPTDNSRPGYHYIRTTVYDNRRALGEAYIEDLEAAYPAGTVLRRRFIDGLRGLSVVGDPVYGGYFLRTLHVDPQLTHNREAPLLEGWDFGHGHPCVVWAQFVPTGALNVLGGVMGASMFIEDFCPVALQYRAQWFPGVLEVRSTGDPAGESLSPHGVARSAADVLRRHRVDLQLFSSANRVDRRDMAIQTVAGYIWDSKSTKGTTNPNTRRPLKDGYYDHGQNCVEYLALMFGPGTRLKPQPKARPSPTFPPDPLGWMAV